MVRAVGNPLLDEFRREQFLSWDDERGLYTAWKRHGPHEDDVRRKRQPDGSGLRPGVNGSCHNN